MFLKCLPKRLLRTQVSYVPTALIKKRGFRQLNADVGYDTVVGWTLQPGAAIGGGVATYTAVPLNNSAYRTAAFVIRLGRNYDIVYTIDSISAGAISSFIGGTVGATNNAPGTFSERLLITTLSSQLIALRATTGATTCVLSQFSVKEAF